MLLRRWNLSPKFALVYWLSPYFLAISELGYTDFHVSFFVVLMLVLLLTAR